MPDQDNSSTVMAPTSEAPSPGNSVIAPPSSEGSYGPTEFMKEISAELPPEEQATEANADQNQDFAIQLARDQEAKAEPAEPEVEGEEQADPQLVEDIKRSGKDLTGVPAQFHRVAKEMSNAAFGVFKSILKAKTDQAAEITKLKEDLAQVGDARFTDHEQAYVLSPEFQQSQAMVSGLQTRRQRWISQLAKCRAGENWEDLEWDEASQTVKRTAYAGDPAGEAHIIGRLTQEQAMLAQEQLKLNSFPEKFKTETSRVPIS